MIKLFKLELSCIIGYGNVCVGGKRNNEIYTYVEKRYRFFFGGNVNARRNIIVVDKFRVKRKIISKIQGQFENENFKLNRFFEAEYIERKDFRQLISFGYMRKM